MQTKLKNLLSFVIIFLFPLSLYPQDAYKDNIKAAKKGDVNAQTIIGACYYNGVGVPKDDSQAFIWWQKAADQGYPVAQNFIGACYANRIGVNTDFSKAVYWYKKSAEQGFSEAQNNLGNCYNSGEGVAQDFSEAFKWYSKSAEQGNMFAQFNLHVCYYYGRGVEVDKEKAFYWVKKSADNGYVPAQFNLGNAFFYGNGVIKDVSQGLHWLVKAAEQGNADAQFNLSNLYYKGDGVEKNIDKYIYWCKKAAENGSRDAQFNLSLSYFKGEGVEEDYVQSFYWLKKSAENGYLDAQYNLGNYYFTATGVTQDMEKGVYWYRKAAENGNPAAQYTLGTSYFKGLGIEKNEEQARLWIKKAANQGYSLAQQWLDENKEINHENKTGNKDEPSISLLSDVDKDIPVNPGNSQLIYAVVIGNEKYKNEEAVPFAINDAKVFAKYLENTIGVPQEHIKYIENATYNDLRMAINWMVRSTKIVERKGTLIFYYAGHGIPNESDHSAYLLPVDGVGNDPQSAYSLNDLYSKIGESEAKSIIILDACFSGSKREEGMLSSARGVAIKARPSSPNRNMIVLTAAQGDETAYPFKEKQHGFFTYFLLKKLQETKGNATLGELSDYVINEVRKQSFLNNGKAQTPTITIGSSIKNNWREVKLND